MQGPIARWWRRSPLAIELGNDPNAVDKNGETAMHAAAYKNVADAVRYLASHGANPDVWNQPNKHGWTPLTIAQGYRFGNFKPSPPTVEALLEVMKAQHVADQGIQKADRRRRRQVSRGESPPVGITPAAAYRELRNATRSEISRSLKPIWKRES